MEKIWFHGPDVARLLEYSRPSDMYELISVENKGRAKCRTLGGMQEITILEEAGFYEVAVRSKTEIGSKLMKFVCSELLPSIRKTGAYLSDTMTPEQVNRVTKYQNGTRRRML